MPDTVVNLLMSVGASATGGALVVALTKTWLTERLKNAIKNEYDMKLEIHKAQLKSESDTEIERLKSQLQVAAAERSIRLSQTFEKVAESIDGTYQRLLAFERAVEHYVQMLEPSDDPNREALSKVVQEKAADFREYYVPQQIYFPRKTRIKVDKFYSHLDRLAQLFSRSLMANAHKPEFIDKWSKELETLYTQIPDVLTSLAEDFQQLLGVEERKVVPATKPEQKD